MLQACLMTDDASTFPPDNRFTKCQDEVKNNGQMPKSIPPSKHLKRLKPWIMFGNLLFEEDPQSVEAGARSFLKDYLLPRAQGSRPSAMFGPKLVHYSERLVSQVHLIFRSLSQNKPWRFGGTREDSDAIVAAVEIGRDGLVRAQHFGVLELFLAELEGTPSDRVRLCEVCDHIFFAFRFDQFCCSKACNHVRHVHRSEGNWERYRKNRKFRRRTKFPAVKGKSRHVLSDLHKTITTK